MKNTNEWEKWVKKLVELREVKGQWKEPRPFFIPVQNRQVYISGNPEPKGKMFQVLVPHISSHDAKAHGVYLWCCWGLVPSHSPFMVSWFTKDTYQQGHDQAQTRGKMSLVLSMYDMECENIFQWYRLPCSDPGPQASMWVFLYFFLSFRKKQV